MDEIGFGIDDDDRDAIDVLPLAMIPLQSSGLSGTRLIKNSHLESVIELFHDKEIGSGQLKVEEIHTAFRNVDISDVTTVQKLANLASYDIYNLRIQLPKLDIEVIDKSGLELSPARHKDLNRYMVGFIRPLTVGIFGGGRTEVKDHSNLIDLIISPDPKRTLANLRLFAEKLDINVGDVPEFLSEYADTFLSISYYRSCLDAVMPVLADFHYSVQQIQQHQQLKYDRMLVTSCDRTLTVFRRLVNNVTKRFQFFDRTFGMLWKDLNGEQFRKFGAVMKGSQADLGGTLCALSVKMAAWSKKFPNGREGSPQKWADFITTDMRQGLDRFSAPAE